MKKLTSALLCACLLAGLLCACGAGESSTLTPEATPLPPPETSSVPVQAAPAEHPRILSVPAAEYAYTLFDFTTLETNELTVNERRFWLHCSPTTPAELAIASFLLSDITGDCEMFIGLAASPSWYTSLEQMQQDYEDGLGVEDLRLYAVHELTQDELYELRAATDIGTTSDTLLLESYYGLTAYESYAQFIDALYAEGNRVVFANYDFHYTALTAARGPQLSDGARREYFLLSQNENGNYQICDSTRFTGDAFYTTAEWLNQ